MAHRIKHGRARSLLIFAVAATAIAMIMFLVIAQQVASAASELACRADTDNDREVDLDEAIDAVTNYLFATGGWTRDEAIDAVTAFLLGRTLTCDGPQLGTLLVRAVPAVNPPDGVGHLGATFGQPPTNQIGGVEEHFFIYEDGDALTPELVDSFFFDPAGTKVTINLKQNIPFQAPLGFENIDFGMFNASEAVEWLNRSNATTNPNSTYVDAGDLAGVFLAATELSEYSFEIALVSPIYFCLPLSQFGCLSAARGPHKVTTVELMGEQWAEAHHVGTGPYVQGLCFAGDRCSVHALDDHWRKTGQVAEIMSLQVPEAQTQIAMLRSGAVDMATLDYKLLPDIVDDIEFRFLETMPGGYVGQSIIWSGNLWEEFHARTGEPLNPWDSPVYDIDRPWLGDPWQESHPQNVRYTDTNNPVGMTDMEQARLVRLALSTAIPRGGINDVLLDGIGTPIYSEYMGPEYPGWDPNRSSGCWDVDGNRIACNIGQDPVPWEIEDEDLDEADRLLTLAGFPASTRSQDFGTLTLQAYNSEAGPVALEVADAIMSDWARLGIEIEGLIEDYGGVISPRMRQRTQFLPILKNGDIHSNVYPLDWPLPLVDTSSSRPGWGVGFESPAGARWLFEMFAERDPQVREAQHLDWVDYSIFWQQYAGVFQVPKGIVVNNRIASWSGRQQHYSNVSGNPEYIELSP